MLDVAGGKGDDGGRVGPDEAVLDDEISFGSSVAAACALGREDAALDAVLDGREGATLVTRGAAVA